MGAVIYLRRSLGSLKAESPAQSMARARRNRESRENNEVRKLIRETANDLRFDMWQQRYWRRLGTTQSAALFFNISSLITKLTEMRDSAPSDILEAWNEVGNDPLT